MKSEIASLMELFLEDDPKKLKLMIKDRMAEVTEGLTATPERKVFVPMGQPAPTNDMQIIPTRNGVPYDPAMANQSPSMQRLMQQNPDLVPRVAPPITPAAAQALAARQKLISDSVQGKESPGMDHKRKM